MFQHFDFEPHKCLEDGANDFWLDHKFNSALGIKVIKIFTPKLALFKLSERSYR